MIVFSEEKNGNKSIYFKCVLDNNGIEVSRRLIQCPLFQIRKDESIYFIQYDEQMKVISDVFLYLNNDLFDSPLTTRSKSAYALRILYCYLELIDIKIDSITESHLKTFNLFLRGIWTLNNKYSLKTNRSVNTVNGYLAVYRDFFSCRGIKCESLFKANVFKTDVSLIDEYVGKVDRLSYASNLKKGSKPNRVPKYISVQEFKRIYNFVVEKKDEQAMIILHLMYGYGLRIGEVLGLTIEDICEIKIKNELVPVLYLRNRMSDEKYQFSKGLPHVLRKSHYFTKDYINSKTQIIISYSIYELLEKYINSVHKKAQIYHSENYTSSLADIVSNKSDLEFNRYIFLNSCGSVLSNQTWNKKLKDYFKYQGIECDEDVREFSLNHRFRHGFAMFHARFSEHPVNYLELQKMMRHKSLMSTMKYFNPTIEDEYETKKQFLDELYNLIPELKSRLNYE